MLEATLCGVPIQLPPVQVTQDWSCSRPSVACSMARATAGGWGDLDGLVALAPNLQDAVAVFLTEVGDVRAAGPEDARWPRAAVAYHGGGTGGLRAWPVDLCVDGD